MIFKAVSIPLDKIALKKELNTIENIANSNQFNNRTIHSLTKKEKTINPQTNI